MLRLARETRIFRPMPLRNVQLGTETILTHPELVNLYGCSVGDGTKIGPFVEIQKNSHVGDRCKISSHTFICEGVTIEDEVFIGHGVMFTNELFPRACTPDGELKTEADWTVIPTRIRRGASIGSNATIICGSTVGRFALVGAGAVVTRDVPDYAIVAGVPAKVVGDVRDRGGSPTTATGVAAP
jgi:acetyltransferase-like isoleucine patch superfamily enzyme